MATLQEKRINFNPKLTVSNTGGNLSTDAGLILVKEFMDSLGFLELAKSFLQIKEDRTYWRHDNISLLEQLLFQLISGYAADSSAKLLKEDPIFQLILNKETATSQPSLSRFWDRIDEKTIRQFQDLNQALIDKVRLKRNTTEMIIDLDSTHSDTFGNQEGTNYNAHYQTNGYHPLVAFDGLTGDFLKAELRSGNVYTSNGVRDFLRPLLNHYSQQLPCTTILVRGDSGFATPEVYETCELNESFYVIRLKANAQLAKLAESFILIGDDHHWEEKEVHYYSTSYRAKNWSQERRVCIKSTREAGELIFRHEYVITNCSENLSAKNIFYTYQNRGTMENFIKETKNGFYFDKTDSSTFLENHA
ncbi:MAG: IS1380 family transposase, partial [Carnobacterium sp.]